MSTLLSIFKISFQQEFAYKANFIMWRVRNILQIVVNFFLWTTIFTSPGSNFFGYDKTKILTYVFLLMIVRSVVLSGRASDVSTDVSEGNLSNYLLKPISYFKYWFVRDIAGKSLNLLFATSEFLILFLILRPEIFIQSNPFYILFFVLSLIVAILIYFNIVFLISSVPFWAPELGWASQFLIAVVVVEFLSGAVFPIDILPVGVSNFLMLTPFPYLIFFPLQVYLGKISVMGSLGYFLVSVLWVFILYFVMQKVWRSGLKVYQALGR